MTSKRDFKRVTVSLPFIFLLVSLLFIPVIAQAQWEAAVVQRVTYNQFHDGMHRYGLTVDANNKLYSFYGEDITHVQGGPYKTFMITKEKGGEWSEPQVVGDTTYIIDYHCYDLPVIDPKTGIIHLIYDCGSKVYYTNSQRANWQKDILDSLPPNDHGYAWGGMVIDSFGNVHIAWSREYGFASLNYFKVYYLTNATGEWTKQAISPDICTYFSGAGGPLLTVEKNRVAHILYYSPVYINQAWNDTLAGTTWITQFIPPPPVAHDWYMTTSFTIDKNDQIHMTIHTYLYEPLGIHEFYYHRGVDDTAWAEPEEITNTGVTEQLFMGQQEKVHVVWSRISGNINYRDMYYAHKEEGEWVSYQILDHFEYYASDPLHFVIDSEGRGHAIFSGYYYPHGLDPDSSEIYYMVGSPTAVPEAKEEEQRVNLILFQNYPNPFNPVTTICYYIPDIGPKPAKVEIIIYNLLGAKIRTLVSEYKYPGEYRVVWDGKDDAGNELASGIYFYRMLIWGSEFTKAKRMVLIK